MDYQLDIRTLLITLILGNVFMVLLIAAYRYRSPRDTASSLFIVSKWLQSACWLLVMIRGCLPGPQAILLSNVLMLGGGGLEVVALLMISGAFGVKARRYYAVITALSILSYGLIYFFYHSETLLIASTSLWAVFFIAFPAYRFIANQGGSLLQTVMGVIYAAAAFIMLARAFAAFFSGRDMNIFSPGLVQQIYYITIFLVMILGMAGFVLLSRERSYETLRRMADVDELTGILNRRAFIDRAQLAAAAASERSEPISFLLLDIDHFKQVNDNYGHVTGDWALQNFASTVEFYLGPRDLFGRYGGEEFALLLPGADEEESSRKAEQLRVAIMSSRIEGHPLQYTVSIGVITLVPTKSAQLDQLYKLSDAALYEAKQGGRNRVVRSRWPE
ncbi:diguanylate cyclase (GGDEF)-like protein [Paenibacillus forsythiae]|uniref:Diguanylate cyclase (GGDEF)-like protein n=1 Tax=Paenibacillus forsythiae TaxID=365616 RepID=A0ABU3HE38_9BACL|nr:GGDEF domain-containing protein [Paenibacillus forsythiae]MDT3429068.1 diguanylate cyclase (GGDEF)-like protein [Paenibacillus forsythiae]